jgi:hypothetical protein
VKAAGDHRIVQEKRSRKTFSRGVRTPAATVERIRADLEAERSTKSFAKKKEADARRREHTRAGYIEDFYGAVLAFLAFHEIHADLAARLARTRSGSGVGHFRGRRQTGGSKRPAARIMQ